MKINIVTFRQINCVNEVSRKLKESSERGCCGDGISTKRLRQSILIDYHLTNTSNNTL